MSLRNAINAKCKECIYDPKCGGGTWREQVAQCSEIRCPLWPYRPQPSSGPYANQPTDPAGVTLELLSRPVGWANSATLQNTHGEEAPEHLLKPAGSGGGNSPPPAAEGEGPP